MIAPASAPVVIDVQPSSHKVKEQDQDRHRDRYRYSGKGMGVDGENEDEGIHCMSTGTKPGIHLSNKRNTEIEIHVRRSGRRCVTARARRYGFRQPRRCKWVGVTSAMTSVGGDAWTDYFYRCDQIVAPRRHRAPAFAPWTLRLSFGLMIWTRDHPWITSHFKKVEGAMRQFDPVGREMVVELYV
ncbi:hypothetical protein EVAR_16851_1 [Eumeta japonica]|uniref:Uncharacterized protein n=1 Tax=Eumeta variegata TaxID=151549 RepID=A0A4C1V1L0_EUMVA|nr:hypothetical protein EVAR_16851_1 [Eumeta japonica]